QTVQVVEGYEIRERAGGSFRHPVRSPSVLYKVLAEGEEGETFRLHVRQRDGIWAASDLPASLVQGVSPGREGAKRIRDKLVVRPKVQSRPRTPAERDAVKEEFEYAETLYLTSILAREEYKVKSSGGVHGAFYLADLL